MTRLLLAAMLLLAPLAARAAPLTIFAAASLTDALGDVAKAWMAEGHEPPRLSFAASSTLARQIEQGAPADLFASADETWMDWLAERRLIVADTRRDLLGNDLVLIVPADRAIKLTIGPDLDIAGLLGPGGRLAVGDPAHVPAGIYGAQALRKLGLWDSVANRLAVAADVRGALLLVERGETQAGIVYGTDAAVSRMVSIAGVFPGDSHAPITYPFAATSTGRVAEARAFLTFLGSAPARAAFLRRGFRME